MTVARAKELITHLTQKGYGSHRNATFMSLLLKKDLKGETLRSLALRALLRNIS